MLKLNLGSCDQKIEGYIAVDRHPHQTVDLVCDLEQRWPWEDSSVDEIRAHDIIEHLHDPRHTMNEAHRVLKQHGVFDIIVPTTDGRGAFQDPTHVSYWNPNSFMYYDPAYAEWMRFHESYGITAKFATITSREESLPGKVMRFHIRLVAIK